MPHQTLQDLQRYTGIQHMHRIGMAERMWRDRDRERHTISGSGGNRLPNPGPDRSVRHFPDPRFLCPACSFITPFHGDFQCGHHRLQLADVPGVGERNQPVSLLPGGRSSCPPGGFFGPLFQGRKLHKRIRRRERKIPPRQRQCFINARTGVPQCGQQHLAAQIRDVMEQGAHFRGQQVFGQFIMNHRHLAECQRCRIIDGNRKLSGIPGMVDRCRQVLHISVHSTGKRRAGFPQPGTFPDNGAGYRHASRR